MKAGLATKTSRTLGLPVTPKATTVWRPLTNCGVTRNRDLLHLWLRAPHQEADLRALTHKVLRSDTSGQKNLKSSSEDRNFKMPGTAGQGGAHL